jgi:hypothetical protein
MMSYFKAALLALAIGIPSVAWATTACCPSCPPGCPFCP